MTTNADVAKHLQEAWRTLKRIAPVPDAVITVGPGNGPTVDLDARPFQVFISEDTLKTGPTATLSALAHDAVHLLAEERGVTDTGDQGRYHNASFAAIAKELGFEPLFEDLHLDRRRFGSGVLRPSPEFMHQRFRSGHSVGVDFRLTLRSLGTVLPRDVGFPLVPVCRARRINRSRGNNIKAVCACDPPRIIRVAASTLDAAAIACGKCSHDFQIAS